VLQQTINVEGTGTTIVSSLNPSKLGQPVKFTATVTSAYATPTGTVTFTAESVVLGTVTLAGGKASLTTATLPQGASTVTATYNGTANFGESSANLIQVVN